MKPAAILAIVACTGIAAFLIGKMATGRDADRDDTTGGRAGAAPARNKGLAEVADGKGRERPRRESVEIKEGTPGLDAAKMTREERLALLGNAAASFNNEDHVEKMLAVIGALQRGEMRDAADLIGRAQRNGNPQSSQVWTALWHHWGKVDPLDCFARFRERPEGKGPGDVRNTMRGWLESDPAAALAWAKSPDRTQLEAYAAPMALAHAAGGDPARLQADLQSMPEGLARKLGVRELYDMELMKNTGRSAAQIYDSIPESLKADAWGATAQRLAMTDQEAAKAWVAQHAGEPGTDYLATMKMVRDMAKNDPEGTAKWAVNLPANEISPEKPQGPPHPVIDATHQWIRQDAAAAAAWLKSLPEDQQWAVRMLERMEQGSGAGTPQR